jgi:integrase
MPLTDTAIRNAKPGVKPYKLADEKGLFLLVTPTGGKWWRLKYRMGGKEKLLSLGTYPEVSLREARDKRDDARKQIAQGIDPSELRKAAKASASAELETFEVIAREWHRRYSAKWTANHAVRILARLEKLVFPWIGSRPIAVLKSVDLLQVLRRIESKGTIETCHKTKQNCGQIFRYAVATGRCERDPTGDLRGALTPVTSNHHAAIIDPKQVGTLLRAIDGFQGSFIVRCALQLNPLVFTRPGELRHAEWTEISLDDAEWRIPAAKMKMRDPHTVPLSTQAVAILKEIQPLTGRGRYVFPSARTPDGSRPMSENAILAALRRMGYDKDEMTGHGFRSTASTILHELGFHTDIIERQLAHAERNGVKAAYNHAQYLQERRKMMQVWADYLDGLKQGARVIPINRAG